MGGGPGTIPGMTGGIPGIIGGGPIPGITGYIIPGGPIIPINFGRLESGSPISAFPTGKKNA